MEILGRKGEAEDALGNMRGCYSHQSSMLVALSCSFVVFSLCLAICFLVSNVSLGITRYSS
jgi:hypothetical protein